MATVEAAQVKAAQRIDGKALAGAVIAEVRAEVTSILNSGGPAPCLATVHVGDNPASLSYIKRKEEAAASCGIVSRQLTFEATVSQEELFKEVHMLSNDMQVDGVIVQLPLPDHLERALVTGAVVATKDVDGVSSVHMGALNGQGFCPCTAKACLHMIKSTGIPLRGKEAVMIGASNTVGIPIMLLLLKEGCTAIVCHIDTADAASHARRADILVVAVGKAGLVRGDWIKPGAVIIDVGINFVDDPSSKSGKRLVGDVQVEEARSVAGYISPVPGGVGPVTVAMLMQNTLAAARNRQCAKKSWHGRDPGT